MGINQKGIKAESKAFYKMLATVYQDMAKASTLREALLKLVDMTVSVIDCERGTIFLNDKRTGELFSYIMKGETGHEIRVLNNSGLVGWSYTNKESLSVPDAYQDERFNPFIDKMTGFKTKSVLCVPLRNIHQEVIGVSQMLNKIDGDFTEHDIELVTAMTKQAALAIESKLFIENIEAAHQKDLAFFDAMSKVSTEIHFSKLLDNIIAMIAWALDAERATLFINDEKTNELYTESSIGLERKQIRFKNHIGIAGTAFTSGKVIHIPYAYADLRFNPAFDKSTGFFTRSILTAPVRSKNGKIIGVTQVLNKRHGAFNQNDESQLIAINSQIAMAIENAKLFNDVENMKNYNESILESMTNSMFTINEEGKIVKYNHSVLRLFNLTNNDQLINQDAVTFFAPINAMLSEKLKFYKDNLDQLKQDILLDINLNINDNAISANITLLPLLGINREWLGMMIMIEDISSEKRMKSTMSRYMSPELAEKLMQSSENVLGGNRVEASVLFSDIRNFTTLSETLGAEETVNMLNEYFTLMVDCIQNEGGILDKFIGDAIMAVFGIPFAHEDDTDRALRAAIAMMHRLREFNEKRKKKELPIINHGIGINTEPVVSGNIGSEKRMDYTVIGDGVNLASRIEGLCKQYGAHILISEFTFQKLKATYRTRMLDKVIVKGKHKPVAIYEVIDFHSAESFPNQIEVLSFFNAGLTYYLQQEWDKAIVQFDLALKSYAGDTPSQVYRERCLMLKQNPPSPDWDGVWVMKSK